MDTANKAEANESFPVWGRRFGRLKVSFHMIEHYPEMVREALARCIVVRCESDYVQSCLEYVALSPDFDEIEHGSKIPFYEVWISDCGERIEFKKKEE